MVSRVSLPVPVSVLVMMVVMMVPVSMLLLVPGHVTGHHHRLAVLPVHLRAEYPRSGPEVGVRA